MRRFLLLSVAGGLIEACNGFGIPAECNAIALSQVSLTAHLALTPDQLSGATIVFCRNEACATGTVGKVVLPDSGTISDGVVPLTGAPFAVSASLTNELDGFTEVAMIPDITGMTLTNGDSYGATITAASGATIFQVNRPVTYDNVETCGTFSKQVRMELYPTSLSGIQCGSGWCNAGVHVKGSFHGADPAAPVSITLCRNGTLCAKGDVPLSSLTGPNIQQGGGLDGGFLGAVTLTASGGTVSFDVQSIEDSAALDDGDVYTLSITQGKGTLVSGQATATYAATFPNGPQCDPVPCHQATLTIP